MAKKRYVDTRFWIDDYVSNLDPVEKLLFLYLLTNPFTDISGVYEIPVKNIALDSGIDKEMVIKILKRFEKDKKIFYKEGWVAIKNFQKHQNTQNPKISRGIEIGLSKAPLSLIDKLSIGNEELSHLNLNSNLNSNTNVKPISDKSDGVVINEFITLLKEINPSYQLFFKRPPQRKAVERLLKLHNLEWWERFIPAYRVEMENNRYCPKATTPMKLEEKLGDIEFYGKNKLKDNNKQKIWI